MTVSVAEARADRIAVLLPSLEGGGAERCMLNLIQGFIARGRIVDLVLCQTKGELLQDIPAGTNLVELKAGNGFLARLMALRANVLDFPALLHPVVLAKKNAPEISRLNSLQHYLERGRPNVVLSALTYANLIALWATRQSPVRVPVVVSERIALCTYCATPPNAKKWRWRYAPELVRRTYPEADAIVTVSTHAADELIGNLGLSAESIRTIFNPVVDDTLRAQALEPLEHPWFAADDAPVILAAGRLTEQKDFATLIRAFALVRRTRMARLVILGKGRLRDELINLATSLDVQADLALPGFVKNPFQYMARASVFVLSSEYEGLPGVLIQAMACGCPVISTDCPGGSREILADGRYGRLVGVGKADELARAICAELDGPTEREVLLQRSEAFSVDRAVDDYLALLDTTVAKAAGR